MLSRTFVPRELLVVSPVAGGLLNPAQGLDDGGGHPARVPLRAELPHGRARRPGLPSADGVRGHPDPGLRPLHRQPSQALARTRPRVLGPRGRSHASRYITSPNEPSPTGQRNAVLSNKKGGPRKTRPAFFPETAGISGRPALPCCCIFIYAPPPNPGGQGIHLEEGRDLRFCCLICHCHFL